MTPTSIASRIALTVALGLLILFALRADRLRADTVRGSGILKTETRSVAGFTDVRLAGAGDVHIQTGDNESLTIEAEDNILPLLETTVKDGRLTLSTKNNTRVSTTKPITYRVTVKSLTAVQISGSGSIHATNIEAKNLAAGISGSGSITLSGRAERLDFDTSGSGSLNAADLATTAARLNITGSGSATVNAAEQLDARITGSGSVYYLGSPEVRKQVIGAGFVRPRPAK